MARVITVTVSDTRTPADDASGKALAEELSGFDLVRHAIVPDEPAGLWALVDEAISAGEADAIVFTGGTGIAPRDQTYEALAGRFDKQLDGFGEAFRRLSWDEIGEKCQTLKDAGGVQVLLQGGINPDLRLPYYEELVGFIKGFGLRLNGFSPEEIHCLAELEGMSLEDVLVRLRDAGLDSVPGGGAEVLVDRDQAILIRQRESAADQMRLETPLA